MPLVVVTGITGFTGSWVCLEFLRSGQFRVRGTTRDLENESKLGPVRRGFGESIEMLEIVQMNLLDPESVDKAFEGATYVVNCAGPVQMEHKDDQMVMKTHIEGMKAVLAACAKHQVKRLVHTSSVAAVTWVKEDEKPDSEYGLFDETFWSDAPELDPTVGPVSGPYVYGKTKSEQFAWEFQKTCPQLEIVMINPVPCFGPYFCKDGHWSAQQIAAYIDGSIHEIPVTDWRIVDIRDVARMHLQSVLLPEAANNRFLAISENWTAVDIARTLHTEFGPKGFTIPTCIAPGEVAHSAHTSNKKAKTFFGPFIPAKQAVIEMANSLIEHCVVKPK